MAGIASLTPMAWIALAILATGLTALSWIDLRTGYLPDPIQIVLAITGLVVVGIGSPAGISWRQALVGAAINAAVFWSVGWVISRVVGRAAMGMGDVKLLAMIAAWLGPAPTILTLILGAFVTALYGLLAVPLSRGKRPFASARLPLGAFLCATAIYAIYAGQPIIRWYLHFYGYQ